MDHAQVLIIGAGVTGLAIAHGLQQAGISYLIFESEESGEWRPKEWTMGIHWSLPLLESLFPPDLAARISKDAAVDGSIDYTVPPNNGGYIFDGVSGKILKDLAVDGRIVRVSRRKLRALCTEGIDVKNGHTVEIITTNESQGLVTATFTNGRSYCGKLLVGSDGPRSTVRDFLFADPAIQAAAQAMDGVVATSICFSYRNAETARNIRSQTHPLWCINVSPQMFHFMSLQDMPDPTEPETWRFFFYNSWLGERPSDTSSEALLKVLQDKGSELAEPFNTAFAEIPEDTHVSMSDTAYWVSEPWNTRSGLVTLAGDSAHTMPPFRGQGGNHAIQDAYNLVETLKAVWISGTDARQAELVQEYSDEVAKRGAEETNASLANGRMAMAYHDFIESPFMKQGLNRS